MNHNFKNVKKYSCRQNGGQNYRFFFHFDFDHFCGGGGHFLEGLGIFWEEP